MCKNQTSSSLLRVSVQCWGVSRIQRLWGLKLFDMSIIVLGKAWVLCYHLVQYILAFYFPPI